MKTDIYLVSANRKIIIDCKFYKKTLQQSHFGKETFFSSHLYQLYAYLRNKENEPNYRNCEGILLYPAINYNLDYSFELSGHPVRIKTIDLSQHWWVIKNQLLELVQ